MYKISKSNQSWEQAFQEVEESVNRFEYYNQMAMHLFSGKVYKLLTQDERDQVDHVVNEVFYN
jgi:hypothetical protein